MQELRNNLSCIFLNNSAPVDFIINRLSDNKYRGLQISQHQRWTQGDIMYILSEIKKIGKFEILIGDDEGRGYDSSISKYVSLVENLRNHFNKFTLNSLKKNIFPDLARMGFILRYDINGEEITNLWSRKTVKYISISSIGEKIIDQTTKTKDVYFLFCKGIEKLTNGNFHLINDLFLSLSNGNKNFIIDPKTWAVFFSGINQTFNGHFYSSEDVFSILKIFLNLSKIARKNVFLEIEKYCNKIHEIRLKNKYVKSNDRDWHNWINEAQQSIMCLSLTSFFQRDDNYNLMTRVDGNNFINNKNANRSSIEKKKYFTEHNIQKNREFILHHIVPLFLAKTPEEWALIDDWKNMIYINGNSHNFIHSINCECLYKVVVEGDFLKLCSILINNNSNIKMTLEKDIFLNKKNINIIIKKNIELLNLK